jgi:hypothetical protein
MNILVRSPTYSPAQPWADGQLVTRSPDGVLFTYSASLNALTIDPNISGIAKNANLFAITNLPTTPTNANDAASKSYVDAYVGGTPEAPNDGGTYARRSLGWTSIYDGGAY